MANDEAKYTPPPWMIEIVRREVGPVNEKALRAYGVATSAKEAAEDCRGDLEKLEQALFGYKGQNGAVNLMRQSIANVSERADENAEAIQAMQLEKRAYRRSAAIGATGGGGAIVILAEVLRHLLGG
jgi:hypothetical protein